MTTKTLTNPIFDDKITVEGGDIEIHGGGYQANNSDSSAKKWHIKTPEGIYQSSNALKDTTIQITTDNYGTHARTGTNYTLGNTIFGPQIASSSGLSHGQYNVLMGYKVASNKESLGVGNIGIGYASLASIDGGAEMYLLVINVEEQ